MHGMECIFQKRILKTKVADWLEDLFEDDANLNAIKLCGKDKAPGPDGFTVEFFLKIWNGVKHVLKAIIFFF